MKGQSTLLFVALALAALIVLEPTANAVVHRLTPTLTRRPLKSSPTKSTSQPTPLDRLVSNHGFDKTSRLQQQLQKTADNSCDSGSSKNDGSHVGISVTTGYALVAEMSIGTPAQGPFEMELDFYATQPYVLKKGAKHYDDSSKVRGAQEYNVNSSTSSATQDAYYVSYGSYWYGSVVSDVMQLGPLSLTNQSVQVTTWVDRDFDDCGVDGSLGLGVSYKRDGSSFVEQLASQLDSPVLTLYANQGQDAYEDGQGMLSFGDRLPEICDASSWTTMQSWINQYVSYPAVDTVAVTGPADSNGCGGQVTANITVAFANVYQPFQVSMQVQDLFVKASGARWNDGYEWYVVKDASKAQSVKFNTASGDVIEVTPNDYLANYYGTSYLYVEGTYDQNKYNDRYDFIELGQTFLNNHCLSMDMTSGEWSLANVNQPKADESVGTSAPASSSGSSEGADYMSRKH